MKSVIVLDIGTQSVKAGILEIGKNNKEGIIKSWAKESDADNVFSACQKVIRKIQKKSRPKAQEIFLGIGSDILKGRTITVCFKREAPGQKIDLAELKYFIQKIEWKALDSIRKEFKKETEFKDVDVRIIDAFIVDIKLDGNSKTDLIGASGQNICFSVYNIYTSRSRLESLGKLVSGLKMKLAGFVPVSYALFNYLNLEKSQKGSALIIDIGGKITEITFVKNGGEIIATKSFHLGGQAFSCVIAEFLGLKLEDAENIKIKYSKGEIGTEAKKKLEKLFVPNTSSWMNGVKIVLDDFLKEYKVLPNKIFICGGGSKFPLIESGLKKEKGFKILNAENETESGDISCSALQKFYLDLPDEKDIFAPIFKRVIKLIQNQ